MNSYLNFYCWFNDLCFGKPDKLFAVHWMSKISKNRPRHCFAMTCTVDWELKTNHLSTVCLLFAAPLDEANSPATANMKFSTIDLYSLCCWPLTIRPWNEEPTWAGFFFFFNLSQRQYVRRRQPMRKQSLHNSIFAPFLPLAAMNEMMDLIKLLFIDVEGTEDASDVAAVVPG